MKVTFPSAGRLGARVGHVPDGDYVIAPVDRLDEDNQQVPARFGRPEYVLGVFAASDYQTGAAC
jgi:hypothetical protein